MKITCMLCLFFSVNAFAANTSSYTKIDVGSCTTIEDSADDPNAEIDYYTGICNGVEDYKIKVSGGDVRYSISLLYKKTHINFTDYGNFHSPGAKVVEWRKSENGHYALIYRLSLQNMDEEGMPLDDTKLFVVRLKQEKSCLVGVVNRSSNMNTKARILADDLSLPCLETSKPGDKIVSEVEKIELL